MRKLLCALMCICLLLSLCACTGGDNSVTFYYTRPIDRYVYGTEDGVIAPESREVSGHEEDLNYILTLYLEGPLDQELISPFPEGTSLEGVTYSDATLYVTLNKNFASLEDLDHTIAAACMASTCFELTAAEYVVIKCGSEEYGNQSIKLSRDSLLLIDDSEETSPSETAQ